MDLPNHPFSIPSAHIPNGLALFGCDGHLELSSNKSHHLKRHTNGSGAAGESSCSVRRSPELERQNVGMSPLDFCLWLQPYNAACLLGHVNTAFQRPGFCWVESQRSNVQIFRLNGANPRLLQSSAVKCKISLW